MDDTDIFVDTRIRNNWYDVHGLLRAIIPRRTRRVGNTRRNATAAFVLVVSALIGSNVMSKAVAAQVPTQLTLQWPAPPTATFTRQSLSDALHAIRGIGADWNGNKVTEPVAKSIAAAESILSRLPNVVADASAGLDGDGHVYFRLKQGQKLAYLTIEPKLIHLLYIEPGQPNVYIDDEKFKGKLLPSRIQQILEKKLAS